MGFWKDVAIAWKTSRAEAKFKKKISAPTLITPELQSEKDAFTSRGEPWVTVLRMDVDPSNLSDGAFELDWNPIFIARLVKAGYRGKDDRAIVDQWFSTICASVAAGNYEDEIADPDKRKIIQRKQLDNDRTEVF